MTNDVEGCMALPHADFQRLALHGAIYAASCDDIKFFDSAPGAACNNWSERERAAFAVHAVRSTRTVLA